VIRPTGTLWNGRSKDIETNTDTPRNIPHFFEEEARVQVSSVRILVVEDFAPFLQFISTTLATRQDLQVICEVSDGLEAVRKAQELRPDLILLDIGLPSLNGIEAARQIRKLVPESKIIFLTQESSDDVVEEALRLGAYGYIIKIKAKRDMLAAVETVISGKQFVSSNNLDSV
jgi:DNA-binding NarL/FixJ family response regulator